METAMVAVQDLHPGDWVYYADYLTVVEEIEFGTRIVYLWLRVIDNGYPHNVMFRETYGREVERVVS